MKRTLVLRPSQRREHGDQAVQWEKRQRDDDDDEVEEVVAWSHGTEHGIASLGLTVTRSLQSDSSPGSPASSTAAAAAAAAAHLSSGCSSSLSSTHRTSAFIT